MMKIRNYMEQVVHNAINDIVKDIGVCKCEKCLMDIEAIALNSLPSRYIVTDEGVIFSRISSFEQQFEVDIISAITTATILVKRNPRHDKE